ncbi:MAG: hypothetical protein K0Q56_2360 [Sporolactobacillus laevolacticus]|nr:hypothetical protein [Sporolactobacillus laevolacticus]
MRETILTDILPMTTKYLEECTELLTFLEASRGMKTGHTMPAIRDCRTSSIHRTFWDLLCRTMERLSGLLPAIAKFLFKD